mgnify:CR=1 FL=1
MKRRTSALVIVLVVILISLMYFDFFKSNVDDESHQNFTPPKAPKTQSELKVMPSKTAEPDSDSESEIIKPLS